MKALLLTHCEELNVTDLDKPEEIARGVDFMCDPASDYITGSSIRIDGGIELPVQEMHRLETP